MKKTKLFNCEKVRYGTPEQAENAMHKQWRTGSPGQPLPVRFYPCKECRGYHHTSEPLPADHG